MGGRWGGLKQAKGWEGIVRGKKALCSIDRVSSCSSIITRKVVVYHMGFVGVTLLR